MSKMMRKWENLENFSIGSWSLVCYIICARCSGKACPRNLTLWKIIKWQSISSPIIGINKIILEKLLTRACHWFHFDRQRYDHFIISKCKLFWDTVYTVDMFNHEHRYCSNWYAAAWFQNLIWYLGLEVALHPMELVLFPIQKFYLIFKTFQIVDQMNDMQIQFSWGFLWRDRFYKILVSIETYRLRC